MPISNKEIADYLRQFADMLEIFAENPYRIRAYRRAARTIARLDQNVYELIQDNYDLTTIPNIGSAISKQIHEIVKTKKPLAVTSNQTKEKSFRNELLQIKGLGKKRISLLNDEGITTKNSLVEALKNGTLRSNFKWVTKSFEQQLICNLNNPKKYEKFIKFKSAELIINHIRDHLLSFHYVNHAIPASNYRRKCELVGNIDWIMQTENDEKAIQMICDLDVVKELVVRNKHFLSVILRSSSLMNFHFVKENNLEFLLLFYTGSEDHINALNKYYKHINSDLEFNAENIPTTFLGATEKKIYNKLGLSYIQPELRENRGEIIAAEQNCLPSLIKLSDIKGDLHSHTNETDGVEPLEVMVEAAVNLGYEYFAITDHSKKLAITNGLDEKRLLKQIDLINKLNTKYSNIKILKSIEVDILEDGSLDLSNKVLKELDIRVCSLHSRFKLTKDKQTERIIRAMDNPYFNILGHMTGRLLNNRQPYALDIEKIFTAAKERGCIIELNCQPSRLDINDFYCKQAKEMGVKIAISSDAHSVQELAFMRYGINQARRGWLEKEDVINTRHLPDLMKLIQRK